VLASGRPASACGAAYPPDYLTLAGTWPADGATAVALDAPLLVRGTAWPTSAAPQSAQSLQQWLHVELRAQGQPDAIEGQIEIFQDSAVWRPRNPLAPMTVYEWKIRIDNPDKAPDAAKGETARSGTFSTGASPLTPLALAGEPVYSFGDHDFSYCPADHLGPCGACSGEFTRPARAVLVTAPLVTGGVVEAGYQVTAWLENGPQLLLQSVHLGAPVAPGQLVALELPDEKSPYEPCLHVEASDAAGQLVKSAVTCFPLSSGAAGQAGSPAGSPASSAPMEQENQGCHASGPRSGRGLGALGLLVVALAGWRRSRSRPGPGGGRGAGDAAGDGG
jgi:hypothetical protein